MRIWDNVYVRWERGDRTSQKDQWRSEVQKARGNETVIFHGSGSVRQLESGYDWTRAQKKREKRLDIYFKMWDTIGVRVSEGEETRSWTVLGPLQCSNNSETLNSNSQDNCLWSSDDQLTIERGDAPTLSPSGLWSSEEGLGRLSTHCKASELGDSTAGSHGERI